MGNYPVTGEKSLYEINTNPGADSWGSPEEELFGDDYLDWLKENHGQMLMILVRRIATNAIKIHQIKIQGQAAEVFRDYLQDMVKVQQKHMREAGTERVPETGSLF